MAFRERCLCNSGDAGTKQLRDAEAGTEPGVLRVQSHLARHVDAIDVRDVLKCVVTDKRLSEMVVAVDQPRDYEVPSPAEDPRGGEPGANIGCVADRDDAIGQNSDCTVADHSPVGVHRDHDPLDQIIDRDGAAC